MDMALFRSLRRFDRLVDFLHEQVSGQSLAVFRIAFGLMMVYDVWRFFRADRIRRYYVEPEFLFSYYGFSWIKPFPEPYIYYAWALVGVLALLVALGLFYRVAIVGFTFLFSYFFLLDKAQYLNHFYMVILFAGLLCLLPANRAYSLDAAFFPSRRSETVPRWSIWALRTQLEIILIYAGLVKISTDWLRSEPLGMWLRQRAEDVPFGDIFYHDGVIALGAYGVIALHVLGAPLLLFEKTRLPVFAVYFLFHISNAYLFNIGIFPWITIAATTIFLPPNWPQLFGRWSLGRVATLPEQTAAVQASPVPRTWASRALVGVLAVWMVLQVLIPLRFALYSTELRWAGDGHRFAWRMLLLDREGRGYFEIADPRTGELWPVLPTEYLTVRQAWKMLTRPDMIVQFAHHLKRLWAERGHDDVRVYARVDMSLNGRPYQALIKKDVNLADQTWQPWQSSLYVTELTTVFVPWRERNEAISAGLIAGP